MEKLLASSRTEKKSKRVLTAKVQKNTLNQRGRKELAARRISVTFQRKKKDEKYYGKKKILRQKYLGG